MREHGYVDGQNVVVERRFADNRAERMSEIAAELVRLKVVRASHQPEDGEGAGTVDPAVAAAAGGRGDPVMACRA